jgi:hypothetical protein
MALPAQFPNHPYCSAENASRLDILKGRIGEFVGRILGRVQLPGLIASTTINDPYLGQTIEVKVGIISTRISVNGRDYYFSRLSGKFNGTGSGCS